MKKTNELDINYYVELAKREVGSVHDLEFQSMSKYGEKAGTFEILEFEEVEPKFTYSYWKNKENDTPDGAIIGYFKIKLSDTKFYNGKTFRFEVKAYVQSSDTGEVNDRLFISNKNADTGKWLKAYDFPILNW